ncbi:MAG: alkyl sulfatase dimerization domain-containing protein [Roseiarcus sp.]
MRNDEPSSGIGRAEFLRGGASVGLMMGLTGSSATLANATSGPIDSQVNSEIKPATLATREANAVYRKTLAFDETQDFEDARRGFVAALPGPQTIRDESGRAVWDLTQFDFIATGTQDEAPDTVNPSLWRNAKLNMNHGLFEVVDGIWQVRGYDLSVMTVIRGESGWIVVDPLTSAETASAVWKLLVAPHLGERPIKAVIYTHSHVDHFGGVRGVVEQADIDAGKIKIYAPIGFSEAAIAENIIAGTAMARRAGFMYGSSLPRGPTGLVDAGLGKTVSTGSATLIAPTDYVSATGERVTIDGVELQAIMAPESEAPSEFMFYLPKFRAFCAAEDATHTLHNLYTLRGAKVRDALLWSKYLQQAIDMFGADAQVVFASHFWPVWDNARVVEFLKAQRDMYRYLHDQTLRLANSGWTPLEIGEALRLPDALARQWYCRSYYGAVYHDAVAQYNLRLGFFDGVPANLNRLTPVEAGKRYVEYMGGAEATLRRAKQDFDKGEYRWVAEAVNHVVFADPGNLAAKQLLADAYEQLGYQAESASWRNFYLTGATELRNGVAKSPIKPLSADTMRAVTFDMVLDFLGVRLNAEKAAGKTIAFNVVFTDTGEKFAVGVENSALHYSKGRIAEDADVSLTLTRPALDAVLIGATSLEKQVLAGKAKISGNPLKLAQFFSWIVNFDPNFPIVTP